MRQRQGKGPVLIRGELREKGIATDLAAEFIDDADVLWIELAREVWCKRFRGVAAGDSRERAKQMRFLQARGFTGHQIKAVFACVSSEA